MQKFPRRLLRVFFFNDTATTEIYTLSLHDALPIWFRALAVEGSRPLCPARGPSRLAGPRSEEHTSELQSRFDVVCRLLLEKKNVSITEMYPLGGPNAVMAAVEEVESVCSTVSVFAV